MIPCGRHDERVGAVDALVLEAVAGVGAGQGREHSTSIRAMKPRSASASLAPTSWFT